MKLPIATFTNITRAEDFHHDYAAEQFLKVYNAARRESVARRNGVRLTLFWVVILLAAYGLLAVRLDQKGWLRRAPATEVHRGN
jgi:hypothetical protein